MGTLKQNWGKGTLSSPLVDEILKAAATSGAKDLPSLAKNPQHLQSSLMSKIGKPEGCPDIEWVELPFRNGKCMHPILLPHDWFSSLYHSTRAAWDTRVRGPGRSPYRYWQNMEQTNFVRDHPVLTKEMWGRSIPLGLHGDAGAFSSNDSLYVFTWNSLLGEGSSRQTRFIMTVVRKSELKGNFRCYLQGRFLVF